jgi:serine/threonine protein kinase
MIKQQPPTSAETAENQLQREIELLSVISHKNIVNINGTGWIPRPFIELEYLVGGTLQQLLQKHIDTGRTSSSVFPQRMSLGIMLDLASAVKYLHHDFHRDAVILHRGKLSFICCVA